MRKINLTFLIAAGVLVVNTFAQDITSKDLQQLLTERNISAIQEIIHRESDNGEAYYMASMYYGIGDDLGANKDEVKQYEYLKKSANLGWAKAQLEYGFYLLNTGDGSDGELYIKKSADSNYLPAIVMLGDLYFAGYKTEDGQVAMSSDIDQAIKYLRLAVEQNNQDARYTLGYIYLSSDYGKQDIAKALELFESNIDYDKKIGHLSTLITLIDLYSEGGLVEPNSNKLIDYYYLASLQNHPYASYVIGMLQKVGGKGEQFEIVQDLNAAFVNLNKAASSGWVDAMFRIGEMYFNGEGTEQSDVNAYIWMAIAEDLSGNKTNYSEKILELIPKRQRQIAIDNKNHYRRFFTMPKAESSVNAASNIQVQ